MTGRGTAGLFRNSTSIRSDRKSSMSTPIPIPEGRATSITTTSTCRLPKRARTSSIRGSITLSRRNSVFSDGILFRHESVQARAETGFGGSCRITIRSVTRSGVRKASRSARHGCSRLPCSRTCASAGLAATTIRSLRTQGRDALKRSSDCAELRRMTVSVADFPFLICPGLRASHWKDHLRSAVPNPAIFRLSRIGRMDQGSPCVEVRGRTAARADRNPRRQYASRPV